MSYLNQAHDPRRRATAIVTAGAVNALLAVGLVAGLTVDFDRIVDGKLIGVNIPLPPPPRPEPTPTPSTPIEQVSHVQPPPTPRVDVSDATPVETAKVDDAESYVSRIPDNPRVEVAIDPLASGLAASNSQ